MYRRVAEELHEKFPGVDIARLLELVVVEAEMCQAEPLVEAVSTDPHDDKFIACALSSGSKLIVSGDKHLLDVDGYRGIARSSSRDRSSISICSADYSFRREPV